jgi:ketosteroid isomerase-like protein
MVLSKFFTLVLMSALLACPGLRAEEGDLEEAGGELVRAETDYAKLALEKGFRAASMHVFADDGIMFAPGPVNGKKYWEKQTEEPLLIWRPVFATIARTGELGYTTGPWELKKARTDEKAQAFGQYVTIWKKGADGAWKVVIDVGIEHPQPMEPPGEVETFLPEFHIFQPESVREKFENTERTFAELLSADAGAAVMAKASDDVRILRRGVFPAIGKMAAHLMLSSDHGKTKRIRAGGGMSGSNDLAYSYGEYSTERTNVTEQGIYLSIWQLDLNSDWKLVLDLQKRAAK